MRPEIMKSCSEALSYWQENFFGKSNAECEEHLGKMGERDVAEFLMDMVGAECLLEGFNRVLADFQVNEKGGVGAMQSVVAYRLAQINLPKDISDEINGAFDALKSAEGRGQEKHVYGKGKR